MVFGNMGGDSATGVAFTRNPGTGERILWRIFMNAQGEDVVAGIRTPDLLMPIQNDHSKTLDTLKIMPKAYKELNSFQERLRSIIKICGY